MTSAKHSAIKAVRLLQRAGHEAYLAGGCVRDMLLKRTPADYDVATSAPPDTVQSILPDTRAIGKAFGVIQSRIDGHCLEVATFRADSAYSDGRHPDKVSFADARADARRRDFTINAIFFDPFTRQYYDFCDGITDIRKKTIRCVGSPSKRFKEDHLRMIRAIRFAAVLQFRLELGTASSIRRHCALISRISAERIRDELLRILTEAPLPGGAITSMADLGLLERILPLTASSCSAPQLKKTNRSLNSMSLRDEASMLTSLLLRTGAVKGRSVRLADLAEMSTATKRELLALKCPNSLVSHVMKAKQLYWRISLSHGNPPLCLLPELAEPYAETVPSLLRATGKSYYLRIERLARAVRRRLKKPLITGEDLKCLGIKPGPDMKVILSKALSLQAGGKVRSKEHMLSLVRQF